MIVAVISGNYALVCELVFFFVEVGNDRIFRSKFAHAPNRGFSLFLRQAWLGWRHAIVRHSTDTIGYRQATYARVGLVSPLHRATYSICGVPSSTSSKYHITHSRLCTRQTCWSYLRNFCSFVSQHKGSDVPSAAHNFAYIINLCSLATQQVYTTSSLLFKW